MYHCSFHVACLMLLQRFFLVFTLKINVHIISGQKAYSNEHCDMTSDGREDNLQCEMWGGGEGGMWVGKTGIRSLS